MLAWNASELVQKYPIKCKIAVLVVATRCLVTIVSPLINMFISGISVASYQVSSSQELTGARRNQLIVKRITFLAEKDAGHKR